MVDHDTDVGYSIVIQMGNTNGAKTMLIETKKVESKSYELHEGINGSGRTIWGIQVIVENKGCVWDHRFDSLAEAKCFLKFCCE